MVKNAEREKTTTRFSVSGVQMLLSELFGRNKTPMISQDPLVLISVFCRLQSIVCPLSVACELPPINSLLTAVVWRKSPAAASVPPPFVETSSPSAALCLSSRLSPAAEACCTGLICRPPGVAPRHPGAPGRRACDRRSNTNRQPARATRGVGTAARRHGGKVTRRSLPMVRPCARGEEMDRHWVGNKDRSRYL